MDTVAEVVAEAAAVVVAEATASNAGSLATGLASVPPVGLTVVVVAATLAATATTVEVIDMVEVTAMAVAAGEAVTAEVAAAIVMGIVPGVPTVRTEGHMPETVVQITVVRGTVAAAVTVMQVATDMPAPVEARPGTRGVAPETVRGLMTDPVGDPVVTMIVIENTDKDF